MAPTRRFVYVLKSAHETARYYVGLTSNVAEGLASHNAGQCQHTAASRPWRLHARRSSSRIATVAKGVVL